MNPANILPPHGIHTHSSLTCIALTTTLSRNGKVLSSNDILLTSSGIVQIFVVIWKSYCDITDRKTKIQEPSLFGGLTYNLSISEDLYNVSAAKSNFMPTVNRN